VRQAGFRNRHPCPPASPGSRPGRASGRRWRSTPHPRQSARPATRADRCRPHSPYCPVWSPPSAWRRRADPSRHRTRRRTARPAHSESSRGHRNRGRRSRCRPARSGCLGHGSVTAQRRSRNQGRQRQRTSRHRASQQEPPACGFHTLLVAHRFLSFRLRLAVDILGLFRGNGQGKERLSSAHSNRLASTGLRTQAAGWGSRGNLLQAFAFDEATWFLRGSWRDGGPGCGGMNWVKTIVFRAIRGSAGPGPAR
jgi:hypothetical protein